MKVMILCGGRGTRIRDVSEVLPKPMLPIGERPLLWHIMKIYSSYGLNEFVLCLGYKGWQIKDFFLNYYAKTSDISLTLGMNDSVEYHHKSDESDWKVTLVETGEDSLTGTRVKNAEKYLGNSETFCLTYGDGVADINIKALIDCHRKNKSLTTITAVHPSGRFGEIQVKSNHVASFSEKPNTSSGLINGGFMVFDRSVISKYFKTNTNVSLESDILPKISKDKKMGVYKHDGYWQCVDTAREYEILENLWKTNKAPWKVWK